MTYTGLDHPDYKRTRAEYLKKLSEPAKPLSDEEIEDLRDRLPILANGPTIARLVATIDDLKSGRY